MSISGTTARIFSAIFCLGFALPLLPLPAHAQKASVRYEEKKKQTNDIAVSIITSGLTCTCARFAEDIRNVVNDLRPDGIRVLPVLGVGGLQNLNDVLFLKGIDMGVVDEDNVILLKKRIPSSMPPSSRAFSTSPSSTIPSITCWRAATSRASTTCAARR